MIDPAGGLHNRAAVEPRVSGGNRSEALKSQSFRAELSDQLASTKRSTPTGPSLPAQLPSGQKSVTWRQNPDAPSTSTTGSMSTPPSGLQGLVISFPAATYSSGSATKAATTETAPSFDDTYWANQPAAVQQLRDIQDPTQREQTAVQLAQEGYSIDVPIMVWGWDPQITTAARESMGYTWVPSALQQSVQVQPGLSFNGTSYDPANPPAGSISV